MRNTRGNVLGNRRGQARDRSVRSARNMRACERDAAFFRGSSTDEGSIPVSRFPVSLSLSLSLSLPNAHPGIRDSRRGFEFDSRFSAADAGRDQFRHWISICPIAAWRDPRY